MAPDTATPLHSGTTRERLRTRQPHVLVVDDNPDIVRVIRRVLTAQDYRISEAVDGEQALRLARQDVPDLMLLDIMLPKIDGLEVCRQLKGDPKTRGIMIILVTGRATVDHRVQGFEAGADDYVPKPFHVPELLARTRTALRLKALADDLAERNEMLVRSQSDLIRSEKMATIGLLASGIAHEFNNIMAGISAYAQLAKKDRAHCDTLVEVALVQAERAFELTRSLSTYNRPSSTQAACDVRSACEDALRLLAKEAQKRSVRIATNYAEDTWAAITPGQIQEVLLNLVLNALHAVEPGTGVVRVTIGPCPDPDKIAISVTDNGAGIAETNLGRVFDPFFTTKGALGSGHEEGTGLGLTVCYNIVNANHGSIEIDSRPDEGSTFTVTLPRARISTAEERALAAAPRARERVVRPTDRPLRVLVVDDEEHARKSILDFLNRHEVVCCSRAEAAIEAYAVAPFDYVILDVCMQGPLNGFEAFDRFQRFDPPPNVIFSSGRFPDSLFQSYIRKAHGHLLKPYKLEDLATLLGMSAEECFEAAAATTAG